MKITVNIRRQPHRQATPSQQTYTVDIDPQRNTVLDLLHEIQWQQDGSLAFRRNCRNVICGSCGMRVNGKATLACQKNIAEVIPEGETQPIITIAPLGNLPVVKDLIVDMTKFWQNLQRVDPYVSTAARSIAEKEFNQTPAQRAQLQDAANCILCGACYSDCNAAAVSDDFVGPHALAKSFRVMADNRDQRTSERTAQYNSTDFAWGCTRCFQCNEVCPVGVNPLDRISQIKQTILKDHTLIETTPQRHRYTLIEMVKAEGWVDESKFGLQVIGNGGKDWRGMLSLAPVGWRMVTHGKMPFPWDFQPSPGAAQTGRLMDTVATYRQQQEQSQTTSSATPPESSK
jgi:succinate dehydrogenase / fumarate reductase, iron-sulfur subunit